MLQKIINILYRNPRSDLRRYKRFGGYRAYQRMLAAGRRMEAAAWQLPPVQSYRYGLPVYFLTGKKYAYQTLFCIASLCKVTQAKFNFILVDDGTFDDKLTHKLMDKLPGVTLINAATIEANLNKHLPADQYPIIRAKRLVYPHIKKLTDVHTATGTAWKLVLDADMLFWQEPTEIINWLKHPDSPLHMVDCTESYGYPTSLMQNLCGSKIPNLLNVGAIGLNSTTLNWQHLETWIGELELTGGTSYYLEQALSAMLVGSQSSTVLPENTYQVNPSNLNANAVLQHYVDLSRKIYFEKGWQKIA